MSDSNRKILTWSVTVALAGFLFGFDTAVISGADQPIQKLWGHSDLFHGVFIMSMALWGTVIGALFGGIPSEKFGRKKTLFWIGILYLVSALGSAMALDPYSFSFFRFIGGVGVGASSVAAPTYISEIAPASKRGSLVATYQFNIVLGILIAYLSNFLLGGLGGENSWRFMLGAEAIPALAYVIMVTRVPNSPRWLAIHKHDYDGARKVLNEIGVDDVDGAIDSMKASDADDGDKGILSKKYSKPLLLAFLLAFFNQLSGINFIIYYAPRILESAGFAAENALLSTAGIGLVNLIFTMVGMYLIDRAGRKSLMLIGSIGYIISLVLVSQAFFSGNTGSQVVWYLFMFIAAHAIGQGAVIWVFISEIFPNRVRAYGQSFGTFIHWIFAAIITLVMPSILSAFSGGPIFAFFAGMMVLQLLFVVFMMPETKGVSLEELQRRLTGRTNIIAVFLLATAGIIFTGCSTTTTESETVQPYSEQHRPQFHFSPPTQWMNDPNGMVYYEGEYHLFYQHYPDSNVWGPMHWGHAVSRDLVTWENLPIALYPDSLGYIFSGSAVIDWNNTSGLGNGDKPPMIAIFTHHDPEGEKTESTTFQYQSIAFSNDNGRTWEKYDGNPVIPNPGIRDFRDPKVFWHEESERWVMIFAAKDRIRLYNSPNLKDWTFTSEFGEASGNHGGVWECPDLFELPIEGTDSNAWVMLLSINPGGPNGGSATQYFVGSFDGETFTPLPAYELPDEQAIWLDHGRDNYAGVTWSDIPAEDGRRLFIGWMSNWDYAQVVPTTIWRSAMTIPRELQLTSADGIPRLKSIPVKEIQTLRETRADFPPGTLLPDAAIMDSDPAKPFLAELEITSSSDHNFELHLQNGRGEYLRFGYDESDNQYFIDRSSAGPLDFSPKFAQGMSTIPRIATGDIKLHVFIDVSSIEMFVDDGLGVMTEIFFPSTPFSQVFVGQKELTHKGIEVHLLKGIW